MAAEYLAKAYFSKQGYLIISPDSHETPYDFIVTNEDLTYKVQVKSAITGVNDDYVRFRNKHGGNNQSYTVSDYDILAGVWVERSQIYLFRSEEVNSGRFGETITVASQSGRTLNSHERFEPYFTGRI